jgi:hypothetical protein
MKKTLRVALAAVVLASAAPVLLAAPTVPAPIPVPQIAVSAPINPAPMPMPQIAVSAPINPAPMPMPQAHLA